MRTFFIALCLYCLMTGNVVAQICPGTPGCLDLSFNGIGKQMIVTSGNGSTSQNDHIVRPDGRVIALVDNHYTGQTMIGLNPDGTLDASFGTGGVVFSTWHYPNGYANRMAIQNVDGDDRIVIAGSWDIPQGRNVFHALRVDRYLMNGTLDTSFGNAGTSVINVNYALTVAIQPNDQKILTVGDLGTLVRLSRDGSLDTGFGSGGKVEIGQSGWSIKALADGSMLVGGTGTQASSSPMSILKFNSNGTLNTSFGSNGRAFANFYGNGSFGRAFRVDLDPYGNIIAGGIARRKNSTNNNFAGARFTASGQLDSTFNGNGMVTYSWTGYNNQGRSIVAQADGKVLLTGSNEIDSSTRDWGVVRFNYDGSLDTTFGTGGYVRTDFGGNSEYSFSARIWTDPACNCEKLTMSGITNVGAAFARYLLK